MQYLDNRDHNDCKVARHFFPTDKFPDMTFFRKLPFSDDIFPNTVFPLIVTPGYYWRDVHFWGGY